MTPHIEAHKDQIANTVIMPGDPLRAKYIADNYLENCKLVNKVRGMYAYTGTYKGKLVTVMASGMGMPSIGIYSYELFKFYDVENIIRIGTCGAYTDKLNLFDVILVKESFTDSSFALVQNQSTYNVLKSNDSLNKKIVDKAKELNIDLVIGKIHSSDVFYNESDVTKFYQSENCLGAEMESFALFHNAKILQKKATCVLTVSNNLVTNEETTSLERQNSLNTMIKLVLESVL